MSERFSNPALRLKTAAKSSKEERPCRSGCATLHEIRPRRLQNYSISFPTLCNPPPWYRVMLSTLESLSERQVSLSPFLFSFLPRLFNIWHPHCDVFWYSGNPRSSAFLSRWERWRILPSNGNTQYRPLSKNCRPQAPSLVDLLYRVIQCRRKRSQTILLYFMTIGGMYLLCLILGRCLDLRSLIWLPSSIDLFNIGFSDITFRHGYVYPEVLLSTKSG